MIQKETFFQKRTNPLDRAFSALTGKTFERALKEEENENEVLTDENQQMESMLQSINQHVLVQGPENANQPENRAEKPECATALENAELVCIPDGKQTVLLPPAAPVSIINARIAFSKEQLDVACWQKSLLDGIEVVKHGRRGSPHARVIFCDPLFLCVFWHKLTNKPLERKQKLDQSIKIADIFQIIRGIKTNVLKRTGDITKYEKYLSLVTPKRSLDIEFQSDIVCDFIAKGFEERIHK